MTNESQKGCNLSVPSPIEKLSILLEKLPKDQNIVALFDSLKQTIGVSEINHLTWNSSYLGDTCYIDGICDSDLGQNLAVWGYDCFDRLFIAIQYTITTKYENGKVKKDHESCTFFQRYCLSSSPVVQGGDKTFSKMVMDDQGLEEMKRLFSGETVARDFIYGARSRMLEFKLSASVDL